MNEGDLRKRWEQAFTEGDDYQKALLAVEEDRLARKAKYKAARAATTDPKQLAELSRKEQAEAGAGRGEIRLEAMKRRHEQQVDDYIRTQTAKHQEQMRTAGPFTLRTPAPDFATHQPYIDPGFFSVGGGRYPKRETKFEPNTIVGHPEEGMDPAVLAMKQQQDFQRQVQKARAARQAELAAIRQQAIPHINVNDFRFNAGGTIEKDGRRFEVPAGIGPQAITPDPTLDTFDSFGNVSRFGDERKKPAPVRPQATPVL